MKKQKTMDSKLFVLCNARSKKKTLSTFDKNLVFVCLIVHIVNHFDGMKSRKAQKK